MEQDNNEHIFKQQDYWQAHWRCSQPKISNMTTGNLTEQFQEFTQGDYAKYQTKCFWCKQELQYVFNFSLILWRQ